MFSFLSSSSSEIDARIRNKFDSLDSLTITSLMASRGYLWVGTSVGTILVYQIPHLKGLPLVSGKPFLASDGHNGPVQVLLRIRTKLDISTARYDQFVSDEERMNATIPRGGQAPTTPGSRKCLDSISVSKEPPSRYSPVSVDVSSPPPVKQIIQQLEAKKYGIVRPVEPNPSHAKPPTPLTRQQQDVEEAVVDDDQRAVEAKKEEEGGYEDASLILDAYPQMELTEDEPRYAEVPAEDLDDLLDDGKEQPEVESEDQIDPSRYEVDPRIRESGYAGLYYSLGNEDPLEQSTPVSKHMEGSLFVFTGGTGLVSFRGGESESLSPLVQPCRTQDIALSHRDIMGNLPCVLAYQIPNV